MFQYLLKSLATTVSFDDCGGGGGDGSHDAAHGPSCIYLATGKTVMNYFGRPTNSTVETIFDEDFGEAAELRGRGELPGEGS